MKSIGTRKCAELKNDEYDIIEGYWTASYNFSTHVTTRFIIRPANGKIDAFIPDINLPFLIINALGK